MEMDRFTRLIKIVKLVPQLGMINIARVINHRVLLKLRMHSACRLKAGIGEGAFFLEVVHVKNLKASKAWKNTLKYFDWYELPVSNNERPNWFFKVFSKGVDWPANSPWWESDSQGSVDIKQVWDLSRFNWVLAMAQRTANGDNAELVRLNEWLHDWSEKNPPYLGPNWACAQEASIRVMHMAAAAQILSQDRVVSPRLIAFLEAHLNRIASTIGYAISQDNNHGVLEAVGLFVGGVWLQEITNNPKAKTWEKLGRKWIENRADRLIGADGSFSMYSVMYHREFLDALAFAECWRRNFHVMRFSKRFYEKARVACMWLKDLTDPANGDAPNIGANDGTRLFPLTDSSYRDFRPSVQFSSIMFFNKSAYVDGEWNNGIRWMGALPPIDMLPQTKSRLFDDSGFALLVADDQRSKAILRYPRYKFRPSKCDALHLDVWRDGENIFRGSGSFIYDINNPMYDYFSSVESNNTIQFDKREQMPRISKFMFSDWLRACSVSKIKRVKDRQEFSVGYKDSFGAYHERFVALDNKNISVIDKVSNFKINSVLRWRLQANKWKVLERDECSILLDSGDERLLVKTDVPMIRSDLIHGYESLFYMKKKLIDVLEIEINMNGTYTTELFW